MPNVEKVRAKRQAFFEKNAAVIGETFIAEKSWRKTTQKTKLPDLLVGYVLARLNPGTVKTKIILEWVANDTKDESKSNLASPRDESKSNLDLPKEESKSNLTAASEPETEKKS